MKLPKRIFDIKIKSSCFLDKNPVEQLQLVNVDVSYPFSFISPSALILLIEGLKP